MPADAQAIVSIKTFRKVATTTEPKRYCAVDVEMQPTQHQHIAFHHPNPANANGKFVFTAPATLQVRLVTANGTDAVFIPLAIAFRRSWNCTLHPQCDPTGRNVFAVTSEIVTTGPGAPYTVLNIENKFNHGGHVMYEFQILVQREGDAALGLIDPDIENQE